MLKTVLITGASSGIGYEFAKIFAAEDYHLVLVARDKEKLDRATKELKQQFNNVKIETISIDLSKADSSKEIYNFCKKNNIQINILVNNAGFATYGFFPEIDYENELNQMQLNMITLTLLTKLFLKDMLKKSYGKILNVSSTAAFQPGPLMAVYYASKAYVLSFSQALANELKATGVTVTALCPGPTRTGFKKRASLENTRLFKWGVMDAKDVALAGYNGMIIGKSVIIPGFKNKILAFLTRFVPDSISSEMVKKLQT